MGEALELVWTSARRRLDGTRSGHRDDGVDGEPDGMLDLPELLGAMAAVCDSDDESENPTAAHARELRATWDAWARFRPFDASDTYRALDTAARLLRALGAVVDSDRVRDLMTAPLTVLAARALVEHTGAAMAEDEAADTSATTAEKAAEGAAVDEGLEQCAAGGRDDDDSASDRPAPDDGGAEAEHREAVTRPVRLRAVNRPPRASSVEDSDAPASVRALRGVDPALPLVTWAELSDTITALLATGRIDPEVLAGFTRRSLDELARLAVERAEARSVKIRRENVVWVVSVLRARYSGDARVTRSAATALVAGYIAELAPRAGVDPRRVRQDMMAWVDVERA